MVKISVIIPVYNSENFLEDAINSVINQTFKDIEIICINAVSGNSSNSILESLSKKHDVIRIFNQNQDFSKARNYAIDKAKGDYISFLDADDIFCDEKSLELLHDVAYKNNADLVCGNLKKLTEDRILLDNPNYAKHNYYYFDESTTIEPDEYGIPWAFYKNIYKKSFLDTNNIRFDDLIRGQGAVFLADVLANVDVVYGVPVDFYAHTFPKRPYYKINDHTKKLHYITHYKQVFDIFEKAEFNNSSKDYKSKFINYLDYSIKSKNLAIYEIVMKVFGKDSGYFTDFKKEYDYFKVFHILNKIAIKNNPTYFLEAKKELNGIDVSDNDLVPKRLLENVELINSCDSLDDYKNRSGEVNLKYIEKKIENSNKGKKNYQEMLIHKKDSFNRKFSLFIIRYKQLSVKSRLDYYNYLREDFIAIQNHELYEFFMANFNSLNKRFFENVINSQSFEEFELFFENIQLEYQNKKLEKKFNRLTKENERIMNSKCFEEQDALISKNSELVAKNKVLNEKFLKMDKSTGSG